MPKIDDWNTITEMSSEWVSDAITANINTILVWSIY